MLGSWAAPEKSRFCEAFKYSLQHCRDLPEPLISFAFRGRARGRASDKRLPFGLASTARGRQAPVAQMDRVLASEARGRGFESRRARHSSRSQPLRPAPLPTTLPTVPITPTNITLHATSRVLEIEYEDGQQFRLPFEFLRVYSPSAEVRGHGPGQETLQVGKRDVTITDAASRRPLRGAAQLLRRPHERHLLLGIPPRTRREPGTDVGRVPGRPRRRRREPRAGGAGERRVRVQRRQELRPPLIAGVRTGPRILSA